MKLIDKAAVVAEIEERIKKYATIDVGNSSELDALYGAKCKALTEILSFLDTLEVKDPYEQCVQYPSIKDGIEAHAETYSFNIESELFPQLTKEQQTLWRKEIEQACISGGDAGVTLARDQRYKENFEVKKVDLDELLSNLDKDIKEFVTTEEFEKDSAVYGHYWAVAKHAFLLGLKV